VAPLALAAPGGSVSRSKSPDLPDDCSAAAVPAAKSQSASAAAAATAD
jgi:hypothetical protein